MAEKIGEGSKCKMAREERILERGEWREECGERRVERGVDKAIEES